MDSLALIGLLWAILRIAVPYVMATLGGTVCERAGVINIALEGILLLSALGTALGAPYGVTAALASGIAAGVATALLYGLLVVVFRGDQIVCGVAIFMLADGLSRFLLKVVFGSTSNSPRLDALAGQGPLWLLGLAGLATLLLLVLCPTFYGHMFMNPKDAPFAVAMVILLLGLVRLAEEYPSPSPRTVLIVGFGAGLSIGCRILGGMALVYAMVGFVPLLLADLRTQGVREAAHRFAHVVYVLMPGLVFGYLIMGLIWPWAIMEPGHPFEALTYFSHFFEKPWKEMFDGALVSVPDMPWSYLPTLFALQLPEVLLALLIAGIAGTLMSVRRADVAAHRKTILLMLTLAATLPLVIAMVKRPALYNGIRHFVFVIPPMTVLAGVAFGWAMTWLKQHARSWQPAALAVFTFGLLLPLSEMIRLHPYEYTHFNHIAGTVRSADNFFMLDYWGLALKQASDGLREELVERQESAPQGRKWKVAVCGPQRPAQVALGPDFTIGWDSNAADFAMTLGEFYCKGLTAPVMVEIKRDDVVFARVYDIRGRAISTLLAIPAP